MVGSLHRSPSSLSIPLDFCVWAPPKPNSTIGDTEAIEIAWCTKKWGTRLIPATALQGVQVLKTSKYIQFAGFIDQTLVDLASDDYGGELDPHGADLVCFSITFGNLASISASVVTRWVAWSTPMHSRATMVTTTLSSK